ncbi:MAG TPA: gamma-glutamyl-gamma-aminobutyrate hydrolase family protein [Candidatus Acidoferrum sp.]|nr:gamma-glutamyl-gamma-aminobutyrate hydrolase family protein [Candidatus Acidoferrum sp.]
MRRVLSVAGSPGHWVPADSSPYVEALRAAGVDVVFEGALDDAAGLLLMGGDDVDPARYGEIAGPDTEAPDFARDERECALIHEALERDLPLLGICRGMQMLNVQQGGSLIQHLPATGHHRRRTADRSLPAHMIRIEAGTLLAAIAGEHREWDVNSRHHQAIARLGAGLAVAARDPEDGVIEAIERPDRRFCLAVQWHPENQSASDPRHASLFHAFASAL